MATAFRRLGVPACALIVTISTFSGAALAAPTKDECIEAHGKGQDLREEGHLTRARQSFLACSQKTCPSLIQSDCARFSDELSALVPTISFAARDSHANDLPDTRVFVDDIAIASRLDGGESYDIDPGKHVIRFSHDGKDVIVKIVVNQGEKGRNIIGSFPDVDAHGAFPEAGHDAATELQKPRRPIVPLVVAGAGGVVLVTGIVLVAVGLGGVPSNCSVSSHECAAPPGDKSIDDAHGGVTLANAGLVTGLVGLAVAAGGVVWYLSQPVKPPSNAARASGAPAGWRFETLGTQGLRVSF